MQDHRLLTGVDLARIGADRTIIHNVRDGRHGNIGAWKTEPLDYTALRDEDIGRTVIYQDHGRAEAGTLTSWRSGLVFARYSRGDTSAAAHPADLCFGVEQVL